MSGTTTRLCRFCGAELEPVTVELPGADGPITVGWQDCGCEGARAYREAEERDLERRRAAEDAERRERAYRRAGVRPRYLHAEHPLAAGVLEGVRKGRGAYICGPVGTGKTHLASAVARLAVDAGMGVRFTDTLGILAALKATYGGEGSEDAVLGRLSRVGLLVVDDLGKEAPTDWTLAQLFRIVDDRYANLRPVVVTTQFGRSDLIRRLARNGDSETAVAIVSRLAEMCPKVELSGADRRLSHGKG